MTSKYKFERDITGAPGTALPFSKVVLNNNVVSDEVISFFIPADYTNYIAELTCFPAFAIANDIAILWQYYPTSSMAASPNAPYIVTTGERIEKAVLGGSRIDVSKIRAVMVPPVIESEMTINIILHAVDDCAAR